MSGDDELFIGLHDMHLEGVYPGELVNDPAADGLGILTDAAGEDDRVDPAHGGDQRGGLTRRPVAIGLYRVLASGAGLWSNDACRW